MDVIGVQVLYARHLVVPRNDRGSVTWFFHHYRKTVEWTCIEAVMIVGATWYSQLYPGRCLFDHPRSCSTISKRSEPSGLFETDYERVETHYRSYNYVSQCKPN